ncbi:glutamine synthetase [Mycobacterium frederiksbergense]|uniref:Glutamine synthetase n=1 Tax=Mycolicibacterium frederiksbergense TaxID=117567 RepID=A0ABT6L614_9MYCO|nr:glutamine synthetase family protein [Mycolicibacterium frederiksbergense]MDH6198386.1 glutamine synthetase [Mycolicibacterium frederiksbergense]
MTAILDISDLRTGGIDTVIVAGVDMYGKLFGKRIPVRLFQGIVDEGLHVCTCVYGWDFAQNMDNLKVEFAGGHTGWHDFRLVPDLATLRRAAWLEGTAICLADSIDEESGEPLPVAPRTILRRQVEALGAEQLTAYTATELEFHLYNGTPDELRRNGYRDLDPTTLIRSDYAIGAGNAMEPFFRKVRNALEQSGIPVEVAQAEYGLGQWEINLEYADAIETADRHVLFKSAVIDMARAHGMTATFMPRPLTDGMGSSCHIHASVRGVDGSTPFHDAAAERTASAALRHAVAGVLERASDLMLFYAPTVNAMRRIISNDFAGNGLTWGFDNRTTTCRLITGDPNSNRLEMRLPGADVNPYLATAAVLGSMRDGMARQIDPGPPCLGDAYAEPHGELPVTLGDAARNLDQSTFAASTFDKAVVGHYATVARDEWLQFLRSVSDWDRDRYFETI